MLEYTNNSFEFLYQKVTIFIVKLPSIQNSEMSLWLSAGFVTARTRARILAQSNNNLHYEVEHRYLPIRGAPR